MGNRFQTIFSVVVTIVLLVFAWLIYIIWSRVEVIGAQTANRNLMLGQPWMGIHPHPLDVHPVGLRGAMPPEEHAEVVEEVVEDDKPRGPVLSKEKLRSIVSRTENPSEMESSISESATKPRVEPSHKFVGDGSFMPVACDSETEHVIEEVDEEGDEEEGE